MSTPYAMDVVYKKYTVRGEAAMGEIDYNKILSEFLEIQNVKGYIEDTKLRCPMQLQDTLEMMT